ncbi:hypothetical protein [Intestinimonas butyriciproducens]|jgi:hypothetical protein|uniref:hypothetical protein n=1 Tax=Intestinimonas butyriciproducens TaxID=1297617 RepID=UPI000D79FC7A|nr:hypothetical protein [Intestinimonas butyriciproducens]MBO3280496.1 hypothetical protein [Intestinimonas butyriciproducens]PWM26924.1 MAG: hypothetical protein DBX40_02750 [Clostridiales bacterium]
MANYCCSTRTNYFHVKAPEQFKEFMARVYGTEDHVELWEEPDADGNPMFAFGTQGGIGGLRSVDADSEDEDDDDNNYDAFIEGLQGFIADDDAIIIQESGAEKLRYLVGSALVITRDHCEYFNILNLAIDEACKLLGNPEWSTRTDY